MKLLANLCLFLSMTTGSKSESCDGFPRIYLLDGSTYTIPSGCTIHEESFNPFLSLENNKILPKKDLLKTGNLYVYIRIMLVSTPSNIIYVKNLVFTKLSSCSTIRMTQELNFQVKENASPNHLVSILPIFIKNWACPNFECILDKSTTKRLQLSSSSSSIYLHQSQPFDREKMDHFNFQIDCKLKESNVTKIKFNGILEIVDVDDNLPLQQSQLFNNQSFVVRLYDKSIKEGSYFKFDDIFYDPDLPKSNNYSLHFPFTDYLSDGQALGTIDFKCEGNHFMGKELPACKKLPSNFSGSILFLRNQKIKFLRSFTNFSNNSEITGVVMKENNFPLSNFSIRFLVLQDDKSPKLQQKKYSFSFGIPVSAPYLTRITTLKHFEQLYMHRSNCPWFAVVENIIYLDIEGGLNRQGVRPGDICNIDLIDNSSAIINVTITIQESPGCTPLNDGHKLKLACSEYSLKEECVSYCGFASANCKWKSENKEFDQTYSTCTVDIESCPDHKCDALEKLSSHICPQDCQAPERFRGFNIHIDEKHKRPIARTSGVIISCHGTCSAIMESQTHSMKDQLAREQNEESFYCGITCIITIVLSVLGFIILSVILCLIIEKKLNAYRSQMKNNQIFESQIVDLELIQEKNEWDKNEICDELLDKKWEFPRCNLILEETIGEGEFGKVAAAKALNLGDNECTQVAVKMLKEFHTREQLYDLLSEYAILKEVDHQNVIKLLGACTKSDGPILIIIEFAKYGSLRYFLRSRRKLYNELVEVKTSISSKDIIGFSLQIAKGMDYLVGLKFVHRDLAARNILLAEDYQCKISDFGLTRDIYTYEAYWKKSNGKIPVKWLSPESLFDNKYTSKSDVWSFGILLWELVTFGGCPYPGVTPERLLMLLKTGYRMEKPESCSQEIYQIMTDCWSHNPDVRPTFKNLIIRLEVIYQDAAKYLDISQSLVNNKTYLEPISSSTRSTGDIDDKSKNSSEALLSKDIEETSYYDPDNVFTHSPPSIKYSQLIHKQSEENLSSIVS